MAGATSIVDAILQWQATTRATCKLPGTIHVHHASRQKPIRNALIIKSELYLQGAGSSSFLSALTGYKVFPSGQAWTTRAPVQLCLSSSPEPSLKVRYREEICYEDKSYACASLSAIAAFVEGIMGEIEPGTISSDMIEVLVSGPGLPSMTFTDLPGSCECPSFSKDLIRKFIRDNPDTILLCLVEAYVTSLYTHTGIHLAYEHARKAPWLVLTRSDQVLGQGPQVIQQQLLKRLLGTSGDVTESDYEQVHAVSTLPLERSSLSSQYAIERELYQPPIFQDPEVMSPTFQPHSSLLQQHCTLECLVKALISFIEQDMCRRAVPTLLRWLQRQLHEAQRGVDDLGPQSIDLQQAMREVVSRFDFQGVLDALSSPAAEQS